jgi:pimeloyl-ACP methyl ester carboxylesterase
VKNLVKPGNKMRKLFWLLASAAVPLAGVIYQKLGEQSDRRRYGRTGTLLPVGGTSIYVYDAAPASKDARSLPAVVFESGIGATSQNWISVQRAVSRRTKTISYDRAGLGWSGRRSSTPTPEHLAQDLRTLLRVARVPPPYLLVAHSFGGLVARRFAADYSSDVAGLVLVDPMRPEDWPPLSMERSGLVGRGIRLAAAGRVAARFGLTRLFMRSTLLGSGRAARVLCRWGGEPAQTLMDRMACEVGKMPREVWPSIIANWSRPEFFRTLEAYLRAVPEIAESMHGRPPLTAPVTILTPISAEPLNESQLRAISLHARQVIASASGHWIHLDEPAVVLAAIEEMFLGAAPNQSH